VTAAAGAAPPAVRSGVAETPLLDAAGGSRAAPAEGGEGTGAPAGDPAAIVRAGLGLAAGSPVAVEPVTRHSNINHVYRVDAAGRVLWLKVSPARPRHLPVDLPRERIASEAAAIVRFGALAGGRLAVPRVLFLDRRRAALGLSDVGAGRAVLIDVLARSYGLLAEQAANLGRALAAVHDGTRGEPPMRPPAERAAVRRVIFDGLLAPGARALFPAAWERVAAEMSGREECLVHADLWAKNLLAAAGRPLAVVDFEGAHTGDPAFDLGTLLAVAALPALADPALAGAAAGFACRLGAAYRASSADPARAEAAVGRACLYAGTFLAARGFGPFAYPMTEPARARLAALARGLTLDPPAGAAAFAARLLAAAAAGG